jgi:tape measure domain-containing protein
MAKRNSVEIILSARDEATKQLEKAIQKTTREFSSLNRSLKGLGLNSTQIDAINKRIKEVNPNILEKELQNVRIKLQQLGLSSEEIDKVTEQIKNAENETQELAKENAKTGSSFDKLGKIGKKSLKIVAGAIAGVSAAIGGAIGATAKFGISFNAAMEQSQMAWETLLGGAKEAKQMIQDLQKLGAKTPFEFEGLDQSAKLLKAMGFNAKDIIPTLTTLGDAVSAVGGGQDMLEGVARAIGQMQTKGKVSAEEMMQLAEQGIPAWQLMAKNMGMSTQELMKMSSQGKIMAKDAIPALIKGLNEEFGGAMDKQSKTWSGMISTIKDNLKMLTGQLTQPLFDAAEKYLPKVIDKINSLSDAFQQGGFKGVLNELLPPGLVDFIITSFETIKNIISQVIPIAIQLAQTWIANFQAMWNAVGPIITFIGQQIMSVFSMIFAWWQKNGSAFLENVKIVFQGIWSVIQFIMPAILAIVSMVFQNIKGVIQGALNVISGIFSIFAGLFTGNWKKMWDGIKQLFSGAIQFLWNLINLTLFGRLIKGVGGFVKGFVSAIKGLWSSVKSIASSIYHSFMGPIRSMFSAARSTFNSILSVAKSIFNAIKTVITHPITTAKNTVSKAIESIKGFFRNLKVKIPLPHFDFSIAHKKIAGIKVPYPKLDVDWYDKGGVFYGPQIIGVGEKRPEFVGALDDLKSIIGDELKKFINPAPTVAVPQYAVINIDGRQVMKATIDYFIDEQNRRNMITNRFKG